MAQRLAPKSARRRAGRLAPKLARRQTGRQAGERAGRLARELAGRLAGGLPGRQARELAGRLAPINILIRLRWSSATNHYPLLFRGSLVGHLGSNLLGYPIIRVCLLFCFTSH